MQPRQDKEADDVVRWRETEARAVEPFAEWTADHQPPSEAMDRFFGPYLAEDPGDDEVDAFAEFLLFDYREKPGDRTLIEVYLDVVGAPDATARAVLEGLRDARPSLYRIAKRKPGAGVVLQDLFRCREAAFLTDALFAETSEVGMVVPCRLYPVGPYLFGRPAGTTLEEEEGDRAVRMLEERFRAWAADRRCVDRETFVASYPELVSQVTYAAEREG